MRKKTASAKNGNADVVNAKMNDKDANVMAGIKDRTHTKYYIKIMREKMPQETIRSQMKLKTEERTKV